jgi:hypothetical protein
LIKEFQEAAAAFQEAESRYYSFVNQKLVTVLKPFFEKHPQITSLSWNQGFSSYNDNTYDYHELSSSISIAWNTDDASNEYFKLLEIHIDTSSDYYIDLDYGDNQEVDEILDKMHIKSEFEEIIELVNSIPGNMLVKLFGPNATVIVNKHGISTETFYGE